MKKLKGFSVNLFRTGRLTLTVTNRNYDLPIANSRTLLVPSIKNEHLIIDNENTDKRLPVMS